MDVKIDIKEGYINQYASSLFSKKWKEIGGKGKAKIILDILIIETNFNKVLDVGSGDGSVLYWLSEYGFNPNFYALEISESAIDIIKSRNIKSVKEITKYDGYSIPYLDNFFDLVTCSHVIEHVEHPRLLLREIFRVSRRQVSEVPIDFYLDIAKRVPHFLSYGHINIFTLQLFVFLLKSEGFKIIKSNNSLFSNEIYTFLSKKNNLIRFHFIIKNFLKNAFS
ncbi:class I SAM-dependent methyltransferase [Telluribacter sp.]|jgi:ubiquinone/menaquinone biosynthesis C-methylase UbiE|uniref:class I SAM-dependent methyltransferase n=1 Tax=Telluribacter sp. TaxID=1978767 RepID=UPI002E13D73A|nr:class I SAM-dependent methyltransferase [Telluribacter sp.]